MSDIKDYYVEAGLIKYVDCPCVEIAEQFQMTISCGKCMNSKKFAVKTDQSTDNIIISICERCEGCGRIMYPYTDICPDCKGKGYVDWLDKVIPPKVSNF